MPRYRHNPYQLDKSIFLEAPPPASPQPAMKKASEPPLKKTPKPKKKTPKPDKKEIHYLTSLCRHRPNCPRRRQGTCLYAHHPGELMNYKDSLESGITNDEDARRAAYAPRRLADWNAWLAKEYEHPDRCEAYLAGEAVQCNDDIYRCREGCTRRHARFPRNLGEYLLREQYDGALCNRPYVTQPSEILALMWSS
ncbi:hypothetical protein AGDE_17130 [Angomonas deanei]|nr:hypothetical protein AGDE_17130 [Angomonas deanei]|eukprot:EPY15408.1 hypothetical protein AGDE_17130 [Angomonas deanei]